MRLHATLVIPYCIGSRLGIAEMYPFWVNLGIAYVILPRAFRMQQGLQQTQWDKAYNEFE